jgi:Fur family ferric uptake transcriptional regulator
MNTVAKCGASGTARADHDTVDASARDNVGPDGWAAALLREVGLPVSRPRRLVLDALRGRERPVTAQDLHWELKLRSREPSARQTAPGLSTIYRILAILASHNVVHCFHRDGQTAYRLCAPRCHDHLLCRCCGRVQEYPADQTRQWVNRLVVEEGFAVEGYRIEVVGLCAVCHPRCPATASTTTHPGGRCQLGEPA